LVTKTPSSSAEEPPGPKTYEFNENALIKVRTPEKIQIDPERWPISEEIEIIEENPVNDLEGEASPTE